MQEPNINKALAHAGRGLIPILRRFGKESLKMTIPALSELTENFLLFDDWEERYRYLLDLGKQLPPMEDALKSEATEVKGCVSKVWMVTRFDEAGRLHIIADSDGMITKGLIVIVLSAYEGKLREEIAALNIESAFAEIGLNEHLSPNRRNGFFAMVQKITSYSAPA